MRLGGDLPIFYCTWNGKREREKIAILDRRERPLPTLKFLTTPPSLYSIQVVHLRICRFPFLEPFLPSPIFGSNCWNVHFWAKILTFKRGSFGQTRITRAIIFTYHKLTTRNVLNPTASINIVLNLNLLSKPFLLATTYLVSPRAHFFNLIAIWWETDWLAG